MLVRVRAGTVNPTRVNTCFFQRRRFANVVKPVLFLVVILNELRVDADLLAPSSCAALPGPG